MAKKITATLLLTVFLISTFSTAVLGFTFPEPDWGKLYYEKQDMINETDFELYTEGPVDSAPYYGARLEPRGGTYIGTIPNTSQNLEPYSSFLTNINDMYESDLYHPDNVWIYERNVVTMVGWTINSLDTVDYNQVRRTLDNLSRYNKPMYIRFANEMNVSPLGDDPYKYVEVFRTVANMVHEYPNFAVVWSPCDLGGLDRPFEYFYPGDEYVDWIGVSNYMVQYFSGDKNANPKNAIYFMTGVYSWATNKLKPIMDFMAKNNIQKPVMISEGGVSTHNSYGDECQAWATPRLRNMLWSVIMKYPQIKMINYFNIPRNNEVEKFDISNFPYAVDIYNEAKNCGAYIPEYGVDPEFVFAPANAGHTLVAKGGYVNLYTNLHIPEVPEADVHYYLDGVWYGMAKEIPYKCQLDLTGITDGAHNLRIVSATGSKEYTFYKSGRAIRFGAAPEHSGEGPIEIRVNGTCIDFDAAPVIVGDRTMVPMRAIFEALGAEVWWDAETRTASAYGRDKSIEITIDETYLKKNGETVWLDVPAQIISDRTFVPARAVAEALDCQVIWEESTRTVIIEG